MLARQHLTIAVIPEALVKLVHHVLSIDVLTCHCLATLKASLQDTCADHDFMKAYVSVTPLNVVTDTSQSATLHEMMYVLQVTSTESTNHLMTKQQLSVLLNWGLHVSRWHLKTS